MSNLDGSEKRFQDNKKRIIAKRDADKPLTDAERFFLWFVGVPN